MTTFALDDMVCVGEDMFGFQSEQAPDFSSGETLFQHRVPCTYDGGAEAVLVDLALEHLFLDSPGGEQPVDPTDLLLSFAPHTGHGLFVVSRIPVGI